MPYIYQYYLTQPPKRKDQTFVFSFGTPSPHILVDIKGLASTFYMIIEPVTVNQRSKPHKMERTINVG